MRLHFPLTTQTTSLFPIFNSLFEQSIASESSVKENGDSLPRGKGKGNGRVRASGGSSGHTATER